MSAFLIRWGITTISVMVAAWIVAGIQYPNVTVLLGASLLLGIVNAFVRPVLMLLSLPFILVTMGLFIFVLNALLMMFVSLLIPQFVVDGFWSAFFGAIIVSFVSMVLSAFFRSSDGKMHLITHHGAIKQANARTIE